MRADLDAWAADGMSTSSGEDGPRRFAATRDEALAALAHFIEHRLPTFGRYEDAMLSGDRWMSHSLLSAPLNLGLLDPLEVVRAAEDAYAEGHAPIAAVEGFVRQIIGWRDYIWNLYWYFGEDYRSRNELRAQTAAAAVVRRAGPGRHSRPPACPARSRSVRESRLGPPHPAADGAGQLRAAARLRPRRPDRLVPPLLSSTATTG